MQRAKPKIPAGRFRGSTIGLLPFPSKGCPSQPISAVPCPLSPVSDSPSPPPIQIILLIISLARIYFSSHIRVNLHTTRHDTTRYDVRNTHLWCQPGVQPAHLRNHTTQPGSQHKCNVVHSPPAPSTRSHESRRRFRPVTRNLVLADSLIVNVRRCIRRCGC